MSEVLQVSFDGVELAPVLNTARKRWRIAYTTVYSTRALLSLATREIPSNHQMAPVLNTARKRWRTAYTTVYSTRALLSLATREIPANHQNDLLENLLHSPPFTVVDVESEGVPISRTTLSELVQKKNFEQLNQIGGVEGVALALNTNAEMGIQGYVEDFANRCQTYGSNVFKRPPPKTWKILLQTLKDPIIIILLICAALSLGFGIIKNGPEGWSDGISIFVAVSLVIIVTALSNIWPKRQFYKLSKACDNVPIEVIRNGQKQQISILDAVVGDVVCLKVGNQVPADGLYINGHSLKVDESNITAEMEPVEVNHSQNPFLLSGTVVTNGSAQMIVTAVGMNTIWGKMTSLQRRDSAERTPLQVKLHKLTLLIAVVGLLVAFLVLLVLLTRYFIGNMHDDNGKSEFIPGQTGIRLMCNAIIGILATPIAIASAAIPEGLLLAVTLTIGYSSKRMAAEHALVRNLSACEATGAVTVICTNKRGTLTLNCLKVSQCWLGPKVIGKEDLPSSSIASEVLELLCEGIGWNTTKVPSENVSDLSDNQTEKAIHDWCVQETGVDVNQMRENYTVLQYETSGSDMEDGNIVIQKKADKTVHVHKRGTPRKILALCSHYYEENGTINDINDSTRARLEQIIQEIETNCIKCIAFAHQRMPGADDDEGDSSLHAKLKEECLNLLGFVGIKNPCRPEVKKALMDCQLAGVDIKMITKDNLPTARAAAIECGIIKPNQDMATTVVEGVEFRNYEHNERLEKADKICVVARATNFDKYLVVQSLKQKGHVVAVTGESMEDAPALREADVGLALGIDGTDIAKENSDIIILDDNFASVARVLRWGRGTYNNIQIFTQFQLTASIASLVIDFVTAISASKPPTINIVTAISAGKVPYAALQVLWVKLIVGTLAAVALTVEKPTEALMQQPPVDRNGPFITNIMWRNIVIQAIYQIIILLTIQFKGEATFNLNPREKDTMIFNIFVLCQIFIIFNTRKFKKNVFKELQRNKLFWGIIGAIILLQVVIVELLKRFANTERLNWQQWVVCVVVGILSWPVGWLLKTIPVPQKPFFQL